MIAVVTTSQNREKKSVAKSKFSNKNCYFSFKKIFGKKIHHILT